MKQWSVIITYCILMICIFQLFSWMFFFVSLFSTLLEWSSVCCHVTSHTMLSIHLPVHLVVDLSIYRSVYLSVYLSIGLSICPSLCPSLCLSVPLSVFIFIYLAIYLCHPLPPHVIKGDRDQGFCQIEINPTQASPSLPPFAFSPLTPLLLLSI